MNYYISHLKTVLPFVTLSVRSDCKVGILKKKEPGEIISLKRVLFYYSFGSDNELLLQALVNRSNLTNVLTKKHGLSIIFTR